MISTTTACQGFPHHHPPLGGGGGSGAPCPQHSVCVGGVVHRETARAAVYECHAVGKDTQQSKESVLGDNRQTCPSQGGGSQTLIQCEAAWPSDPLRD